MKRFLMMIALALVVAPAFAEEKPTGTQFDTRVQYVNYNEDDVVQVNCYPGVSTHIVFGVGEKVVDVSSGFAQGWQADDDGNNLFIKPQSIKISDTQPVQEPSAGHWDTNLEVTTNKHIYTFALVLIAGTKDGTLKYNDKVAYRITFRYPAEEAAKAKELAEQQVTQDQLNAKTTPKNWHYSEQLGKNSESIKPTKAYDDGRFTYLTFPHNSEMPAIFVVADDKSESIVNRNIDPSDPDTVIIHRIGKQFNLRLDKAVVAVYNDDYDAVGEPSTSGTTVPGVKREIRQVPSATP